MKIEKILYENETLTKEQINELEEAEKSEIVYDEESPALTCGMKKAFMLAALSRNRMKNI